MPRIAIVTPDIVGPIKNGGIGTACYHYARTLVDLGYLVDIAFTVELEAEACRRWAAWYAQLGINFFILPPAVPVRPPRWGADWYTERAWQIVEFLRRRSYDYIIFQDWQANGFWATRAKMTEAGFADTPIALIAHSPTQWQNEGMRTFGNRPVVDYDLEWAERETIAAVDILISPSRYMIDWLTARGYRLPRRLALCPYTYEDAVVAGDPAAADRDHLIFFGRIETRKGAHLLGGALRRLKKTGRKLPRQVSFLGKYAQVDDRPAAAYLADLARDLPEITFTVETDFDYRAALDHIRRSRGVVVIPSLLDNFPLTVVESIANGFCFIAAETGGITEMIDATVGFPASVGGLADKLERLGAIDFAALRHRYDPAAARRIWRAHIAETLGTAARHRRVPAARGKGEIPPISVCVPFYRHDRYIRRMVQGFLAMRRKELQLVVVDDGTPAAECREFDILRAALEPLGHVFHRQQNAGPGAARNKAVALARHDLLLFFDADNVPFPDLPARLWRAMAHSGADSVAASFAAVAPMTRTPVIEDTLFVYRASGGSLLHALFDNVVGDACSLVRRAAVESVGGFAESREQWENWDFFVRVIAAGYRHIGYPDPLYFYTADPCSRHLPAQVYECRSSLFDRLDELPGPIVARLAKALAKQYIVAAGRAAPAGAA